MAEHAVVVVGGGPVGLMLAGELALAGVDVAIVERRASQALVGSRAGGLHARALELLDQRGIVERFLAAGETTRSAFFATVWLDMSDFPTRHPYVLGLFQNHIERILAGWVTELPVTFYRSTEVVGVTQDGRGVEVQLAAGQPLAAQYLVGCDGGRSLIRKAVGIDFPGWAPTVSSLIAEVEMSREPAQGIRHDGAGVHAMHLMEDGRTVRVVSTERQLGQLDREPGLDELSAELTAVYGHDFGVHSPTWISRFTNTTRQAESYRAGRVLLAGDAAHIHHPVGGQGLTIGLQDAVNLGWKLAQVVNGIAAEGRLDTYHAERHPAGARALALTMAGSVLLAPDARTEALRDTVAELLGMDEPRRHLAGRLSGLDTHYDLGEGHPLLGRRMPDLDLVRPDGPVRLFELLHSARPLLLNLGEPGALARAAEPWAARVELVDAEHTGEWSLPVIGVVPAPTAVLIRPDGHVAWVGEGTEAGLGAALLDVSPGDRRHRSRSVPGGSWQPTH